MTNSTEHTDHQLDDLLADFTDQLLDSNLSIDSIDLNTSNPDLLALQKTVKQIALVFDQESIDSSVVKNIKPALMDEFKKANRHKTEIDKGRFSRRIPGLQKVLKPFQNQNPVFHLGLVSVAVILVLVIMSVFMPDFVSSSQLTGTALGGGFPVLMLLIVGIIIGLVYWFTRNK